MIIDTTLTKIEKDIELLCTCAFARLKVSIGAHVCEDREIGYYGVPKKLRLGFFCSCGVCWEIRLGDLLKVRSLYPEIEGMLVSEEKRCGFARNL